MYLIVGLGNPEADYAGTRHNMGFDTINEIANEYKIDVQKKKFKSLYAAGTIENEKVILLKPQTFMNLSGEAIRECIDYYHIDIDNLIIIYDDMDTDIGKIRIRKSGGPGGHNGMKSILNHISENTFPRIRVGIGKPENKDDMIQYVIGFVPKDEKEELKKGVLKAKDAVIEILKTNIDIAMNKFNK